MSESMVDQIRAVITVQGVLELVERHDHRAVRADRAATRGDLVVLVGDLSRLPRRDPEGAGK